MPIPVAPLRRYKNYFDALNHRRLQEGYLYGHPSRVRDYRMDIESDDEDEESDDESEAEEEYAARAVLNKKVKGKQTQYLVDWEPERDENGKILKEWPPSWQPAAFVSDDLALSAQRFLRLAPAMLAVPPLSPNASALERILQQHPHSTRRGADESLLEASLAAEFGDEIRAANWLDVKLYDLLTARQAAAAAGSVRL